MKYYLAVLYILIILFAGCTESLETEGASAARQQAGDSLGALSNDNTKGCSLLTEEEVRTICEDPNAVFEYYSSQSDFNPQAGCVLTIKGSNGNLDYEQHPPYSSVEDCGKLNRLNYIEQEQLGPNTCFEKKGPEGTGGNIFERVMVYDEEFNIQIGNPLPTDQPRLCTSDQLKELAILAGNKIN